LLRLPAFPIVVGERQGGFGIGTGFVGLVLIEQDMRIGRPECSAHGQT
jgi:hypothetical protein